MTVSNSYQSQAFSFMSSLQGGVDPRTGLYTFACTMPELQSNELSGPTVPLGLTFNPMNTLDSGYGLGWNLNLSQFTPHNNMLSLSTGETFKVTGSGQTPDIKEKKLDTFHFENNQDGTYRVLHKSGLIETLELMGYGAKRVALPIKLQSPTGHSVSLTYIDFNGHQRLASISDDLGKLLLQINRPMTERVDILLYPENGPLACYQLKLNGSGWVTEIVLPTEEQASWRLGYELIRGTLCLRDIKSPVGGHETVDYQDAGHPFPASMLRPNLPRVTRHRMHPGFGQAIMETVFSYDHLGNGYNFLGYGTSTQVVDGLDTLYDAPASYVYGTRATLMEGTKAVRQVDRTFSRFHLLTRETTTQDHCVQEVVNSYYADDRSFDQQDSRFQLIKHTQTTWKTNNSNDYRAESVSTEYDLHGNLIEEIQNNGIKTVYTYYPKQYIDGFVRELKDTTVYPLPIANDEAPILRTRLTYTALPALAGTGLQDWLAVETETVLQVKNEVDAKGKTVEVETELQVTTSDYYKNNPEDSSFLHGRLRSLSNTLNGNTSYSNYEYSKPISALVGEPVLQTTEIFNGFDGNRKSSIQQQSLLTAEPVLTSDANDVQTLIRYDALGRVTSKTIAPGTDAEASAVHVYTLASVDGGQAFDHFTDFKNVQTVTRYDGASRTTYQGIHDPDQPLCAEPRQTYSAQYDCRGDLISDTAYDWLEEKALTLTTLYERDAWGVQRSVTGPNGVTSICETTPFGSEGRIERRWEQSAESPPVITGLSVSEYNRFGKLDSVRRLDAQPLNARLLRAHGLDGPRSVIEHIELMLNAEELPVLDKIEYTYDGLGNCIKQDEYLAKNQPPRTTRFQYDAWGRMHSTTLPDKTLVTRDFAAHSGAEQPVAVHVKPGGSSSKQVTVGEQAFDSLMRLTERKVGSRTETFGYNEGKLQISERVTPSKRTFKYEYDLTLTAQPKSIKNVEAEEITFYSYNQKSAKIIGAQNKTGSRSYTYTAAGHLSGETWRDNNGCSMKTSYVKSLQGRTITRNESKGLETVYAYDDKGRVERVTQGALQGRFEYDSLGRNFRTTTSDLSNGSVLVTDLEFDSLGRETRRTLSLSGHPDRTITQTWSADDQLQSRHLESQGLTLLKEEFIYDQRNRLQQHNCTGKTLPQDAHGNEIVEQIFKFDALNNIERCMTTFKNDEFDDAQFTYATDGSCQLLKVTHSYTEGGYEASRSFEYDADGHMLNDDQGQSLNYDSYGRLLTVKDPSGEYTLSTYRYDGHDHLIGVTDENQRETLRFYQGYQLSHTVQDGTLTQYLFDGAQPLGQQQLDDHEKTMLLLTDASPHVIGESLQAGLRTAVYNAYGERSRLEELECLLAFNSEVRESLNGWYLLGRGYRAYNPSLMRFHSPDSLSPFGAGGINPYVYCLGNPINFRDPTGHIAQNGHPGDDGGTIRPVVQESDLLGKIGYAIGFAIAAVIAIGMAVPTGGASLSLVAVGIAVVTTAFAGVGIVGVFTENSMLTNIGMIGTAVVGALTLARFGRNKVSARLDKSRNKKAEIQNSDNPDAQGTSNSAVPSANPVTTTPRPGFDNTDAIASNTRPSSATALAYEGGDVQPPRRDYAGRTDTLGDSTTKQVKYKGDSAPPQPPHHNRLGGTWARKSRARTQAEADRKAAEGAPVHNYEMRPAAGGISY